MKVTADGDQREMKELHGTLVPSGSRSHKRIKSTPRCMYVFVPATFVTGLRAATACNHHAGPSRSLCTRSSSGRTAEEQHDPENCISCSSGSAAFWLQRLTGGRSAFVRQIRLPHRGLNESGSWAAKVDESRTSRQ